MLGKRGQGGEGDGFRDLIMTLQREIHFGQDEIADPQGVPGGTLLAQEPGGHSELVQRLPDHEAEDERGVEAEAFAARR